MTSFTSFLLLAASILISNHSSAQAKNLPRFAVWDASSLAANAARFSSLSKPPPLLSSLVKSCDAIVANDSVVYSVTVKNANPALTPPSGDVHDYYSLARYFWPNPNTTDGLPYIRRDGLVNPEIDSYPDRTLFTQLTKNLELLALGYYFTNNTAYAQKFTGMVRQWFLDPATAMNPNLNYASAIRGVKDGTGRSEGVLDFVQIYQVLDGLALVSLAGQNVWSEADDAGMRSWCTQYLEWLWESEAGMSERNSANNHGTWYIFQLASIAHYLGRKDVLAWAAMALAARIDDQIDMSRGGVLTYEMDRANSFFYSTYQLRSYLSLTALFKNTLRINPLLYQGPQNQSILAAIDFVASQYAKNETTTWPGTQTIPANLLDFVPVVRMAQAARVDVIRYRAYKESEGMRVVVDGRNGSFWTLEEVVGVVPGALDVSVLAVDKFLSPPRQW